MALRNGQTKFIGVSNFDTPHLQELFGYAIVRPVINQVELHPFLPRKALTEYCRANNILVEAYGSIVQAGDKHLITNRVIKDMATRLSKSPAQVALRWAVQQSLIVLPKTS